MTSPLPVTPGDSPPPGNSHAPASPAGEGLSGAVAAAGLTALLFAAGCRGAGWTAPPEMLAPPRQIALALGDPHADTAPLDPASLPALDPPGRVRPCCSFGMDLAVRFQGAEVPAYRKDNVTSIEDLGHHEYDHGALALRPNERFADIEKNGLVYTCRGGFVDTAHVRDNADLMMYIGLRIAEKLPRGGAIEIPGDGAMRRVLVKEIPAAVLDAKGRLGAAATLAQWAVYQLSIWHEITTWYGWESVPGFSEKVSTFSIEDMYSNLLGIKIGAALLEGALLRTRDGYNAAMDAWLAGALRHLGAVPKQTARAAMRAVDGTWWDSRKALPDSKVVLRRSLDITPPIRGWRIEDAQLPGGVPADLRALCKGQPPPLELSLPGELAGLRIEELVTVEIRPDRWAVAAGFPFPNSPYPGFTSADYPKILEAVRADLQKELGEGFDRPGPPPGK